MTYKEPVIAIVGRPNVGKSSLTNKIIGKRQAIVHDMPGVTRDRNYYDYNWLGKTFKIMDTGGIYNDNKANLSIEFQADIEKQVTIAIAEADIIIFLVDGKTGIHPLDKEIAILLRRANQKVIMAINKMETNKRDENVFDFYALGFDEVHPISAITGMGVAELLDLIVDIKPSQKDQDFDAEPELEREKISVAIVGRPNAGKSSLLNTLLGKERSIVSPIAGTTRDSIDEEIIREKTRFCFIDTAGIRKKAKVNEDIEYYSVNRAIQSIERADIAILVIDATRMVEEQDQKIAGLIEKAHKACIIVINKWDLITKDSNTINEYEGWARRNLKFMSYAPVLFISATEHLRTYDIYKFLISAYDSYRFRATTGSLNKTVEEILAAFPPRTYKGKNLRIYYATQVKTCPPIFTFFVNNANLVHFSYKRHLQNQLREAYNLWGTPILTSFRSKKKE